MPLYGGPTGGNSGLMSHHMSVQFALKTETLERASRPKKRPSGTIWPNGEFGLGYAPLESCEEIRGVFSPHDGWHTFVKLGGDTWEHFARPPLDLTSLRNSHRRSNRPETYGRGGLTGYGAKMVRNAAWCLQKDVGKENLTFLTLTLPDMAESDAIAVAESWGELMRQLLQYLSRRLQASGLDGRVVLVTEVQPKRFESGSHSVLHVHGVFQGRLARKTWSLSPKDVRRWWLSALSRVTGGSVESLSCCDMKMVRRDAGNYLSKYLSKGTEYIEALAGRLGWRAVPRQWWNMNKRARDAVKVQTFSSEAAATLLDCWVAEYLRGGIQDYFKFVRSVEVQATEFQSFVVGFWGRLTEKGKAEMSSLVAGGLC